MDGTLSTSNRRGFPMKRAVLYLRVSTVDQTTANQERELREVADRMGCEIVRVYKDHGISGAKGRDKRPQFDRLCRDAAQRQFDVVMAWSVDRLGRSLQDLVGFLSELHALRIDLFLHRQGARNGAIDVRQEIETIRRLWRANTACTKRRLSRARGTNLRTQISAVCQARAPARV